MSMFTGRANGTVCHHTMMVEMSATVDAASRRSPVVGTSVACASAVVAPSSLRSQSPFVKSSKRRPPARVIVVVVLLVVVVVVVGFAVVVAIVVVWLW